VTATAARAALFGAVLVAGCSGGKSYALVTVRAASGEFTNVAQFGVYLTNGPSRKDTLYYPRSPGGPYRVSATDTVDFSVSFSSSYLGELTVGVAPLNISGDPLGYGEATRNIDPGGTLQMDVVVQRDALPPEPVGDGGLPPPACEPTNPGTCGAANTCYVRCFGGTGVGTCTPSGQGQPGHPCNSNLDCAAGSQCFQFGCGKICMQFCKDDGVCGEGRCKVGVPCGSRTTVHQACTVPCDPRGDGTVGCGGGLRCYLLDDEVPSCDCRGADRGDGEACQAVRDCQPGHVCVEMENAARVCRPLCRLADGDGPCGQGRICARLVRPEYQTWGACLPP
jgi:hypothetical protein